MKMYELIQKMKNYGYSFSEIKLLIEKCCGTDVFTEEFVQARAIQFIEDLEKYGVDWIAEELISINNFGRYDNSEFLKVLYKELSKKYKLEKEKLWKIELFGTEKTCIQPRVGLLLVINGKMYLINY